MLTYAVYKGDSELAISRASIRKPQKPNSEDFSSNQKLSNAMKPFNEVPLDHLDLQAANRRKIMSHRKYSSKRASFDLSQDHGGELSFF